MRAASVSSGGRLRSSSRGAGYRATRAEAPVGYAPNMRPEILFPLFAPVTSLKGVGPRVAPLLERVAGTKVRDVVWLKPHSVIRRTPAVLSAARDGEIMTFEVVVDRYERPRSRAQPWRMRVSD